MQTASDALPLHSPAAGLEHVYRYRLAPGGDPDDEPKAARIARPTSKAEELPYKVELWDQTKTTVEEVLAVTAHGSIGYAAYYAATREYPDRYITLRHRNRTIARWNGS